MLYTHSTSVRAIIIFHRSLRRVFFFFWVSTLRYDEMNEHQWTDRLSHCPCPWVQMTNFSATQSNLVKIVEREALHRYPLFISSFSPNNCIICIFIPTSSIYPFTFKWPHVSWRSRAHTFQIDSSVRLCLSVQFCETMNRKCIAFQWVSESRRCEHITEKMPGARAAASAAAP